MSLTLDSLTGVVVVKGLGFGWVFLIYFSPCGPVL